MNILQFLSGEQTSSPVVKETQVQNDLARCDDSIRLLRMFYDDALSRKDIPEIRYFHQEIQSERRARRALLAETGEKEVHVCV